MLAHRVSAALVGVAATALLTAACAGGRTTTGDSSSTSSTDPVLVPTTTCAARVDVIVFVNPAAGATAVPTIEAALASLPGVASVTIVDQEEAYEEFKRLFADSPELLESVEPGSLPPSLRITVDDPAAIDAVMAAAEALDGVGQVIVPEPSADPGAAC